MFSGSALAKQLSDPTKPKVASASAASGTSKTVVKKTLSLQSVFVKESGYLAVISGEIVKLGEQFQGYIVTHIDAQSVTLKQGQQTKILRLYQHDIKK